MKSRLWNLALGMLTFNSTGHDSLILKLYEMNPLSWGYMLHAQTRKIIQISESGWQNRLSGQIMYRGLCIGIYLSNTGTKMVNEGPHTAFSAQRSNFSQSFVWLPMKVRWRNSRFKKFVTAKEFRRPCTLRCNELLLYLIQTRVTTVACLSAVWSRVSLSGRWKNHFLTRTERAVCVALLTGPEVNMFATTKIAGPRHWHRPQENLQDIYFLWDQLFQPPIVPELRSDTLWSTLQHQQQLERKNLHKRALYRNFAVPTLRSLETSPNILPCL